MEQKNSQLGIASLVINIAVLVMACLLAITAAVNPPWMSKIPLSVYFIFPLLSIVGLAFGIIGLVQKGRKKVFAILGTILSALIISFFTCLAAALFFSISSTM